MYGIADLIAKEIQADFNREAVNSRLAIQARLHPTLLDRMEGWIVSLPQKLSFWRHHDQALAAQAVTHRRGA